MRRTPLLLLVVAVLAGCGGGSNGSEDSGLAAPLAYDESEPVDLVTAMTERRPGGAYFVTPAGDGEHPAVIYAHGAGGDKAELVERATVLARRGAVGLAAPR